MPRPRCLRRVAGPPDCCTFRPAGTRSSASPDTTLTVDEFEAVRLADLEGLYQEQVAERMNVSRQTVGRILESAHRKVALALVEGRTLRIQGGDVEMADMRTFECYQCQHTWQVPCGTPRPEHCPECQSTNLHRAEDERGAHGAGRGRHGHGCCCERAGRQTCGGQGRRAGSPAPGTA